MSICVIVMGGDTANRLESTTNVGGTVAGAGGTVNAGCAKCIQTQRIVISKPSGSTEYTCTAMSNAELKPAETYILNFPLRSDAEGWLNSQAKNLVGKTVYIIDPSLTAPDET